MPEREAMALGLDGDALDRSRYAGSGQRLPTTEVAQATSSVTCRSEAHQNKNSHGVLACQANAA